MTTETEKNQPPAGDSLKAQSAFLLFAKVVGFGFSFLLPLLIVRYLTAENVGLYRESFLVIMNAATILPLGFSMSAYYFLAREKDTRRGAVVFNILAFNFAAGALAFFVLFFYPQLLGNLFRSGEMTSLAPKIGVVIWLWIFSTFLETIAIANNEARIATAFIIFAQVSKTVLMLAAVAVFATVDAFLYAAIAQGALQSLILIVYLRSRFPRFWARFDFAFFVEQAKYAVPFGLIAVLWMMQTDVHNYFVAHKFSSAEFAVYAYGCFQVPLIAMLAESVASVLIPRMSALAAKDDRAEMIRLTARAMQKLAFFYFPAYLFLLITAQTFIVTLFTENYLASVPIFMINLTLLPFNVFLSDPIARAYKELSRKLLIVRVLVLAALVATLYFALDRLDMRGMILVAIGAVFLEKIFAETIIIRRVGFGRKDLHLLGGTVKTAVCALAAGAATFAFYHAAHAELYQASANLLRSILPAVKTGIINFAAGSFTLAVCALVFAIVYLPAAYYSDLIEDNEKQFVKDKLAKLKGFFNLKRISAEGEQLTINQ